jgi:glucokinase
VFLAVDVGGTKIEVCRFDESLQLLHQEKLKTKDFSAGSLKFFDDLKGIIRSNLRPEIKKIGLSMNCPVHHGTVLFSSILGGASNFPLKEKLEAEFKLPVSVEDDIHAQAHAELRRGFGRQYKNFTLVNLGTGFGVAHVENSALRGFQNTAGLLCIHKMWVEELARPEICDNLLCGKGVAYLHNALHRQEVGAEDVFRTCASDPKARQTVDVFSKYMAKMFVQLSLFYNPEAIVINGSLKKAADCFFKQTVALYRSECRDFVQAPHVLLSEVEHAACLGTLLD